MAIYSLIHKNIENNKLIEMLKTEKIDINQFDFKTEELEVIALVQKNYKNREIAKELHKSESTIKYHLNKIYKITQMVRDDIKNFILD